MLNFLFRLDDACPKMNKENWIRVEELLDKHGIKPIVGIIPESRDPEFDWEYDEDFWTITVNRWKRKKWILAQHGCYHTYLPNGQSEFAGLPYDEQMKLILDGNRLLQARGVNPRCFFAPAHSFDDATVDVIRDSGLFEFILDGKAFYPYRYRGMLFYPCAFDAPHKTALFGIFTFVSHPNGITDKRLSEYENFFYKYRGRFCEFDELDKLINKNRQLNFFDKMLGSSVKGFRWLRKMRKDKR